MFVTVAVLSGWRQRWTHDADPQWMCAVSEPETFAEI